MSQSTKISQKEKTNSGTGGEGELRNEGEGSRSAARRYDEAAQRAASDPKEVERLAKEAARALKSPEGKKLREAEARGKKADHR
jgi:hypothetical protein